MLVSLGKGVGCQFHTTRVPWGKHAAEDLKFESPIFLVLSCQDWLVVLCPRTDEEGVQWRAALDTVNALRDGRARIITRRRRRARAWTWRARASS